MLLLVSSGPGSEAVPLTRAGVHGQGGIGLLTLRPSRKQETTPPSLPAVRQTLLCLHLVLILNPEDQIRSDQSRPFGFNFLDLITGRTVTTEQNKTGYIFISFTDIELWFGLVVAESH